jgi:hypothetical protein
MYGDFKAYEEETVLSNLLTQNYPKGTGYPAPVVNPEALR